ncbi:MAG: ABC transporter ATP-binding protein [Casimicrobiaceae bacterium]
MSFLALDRVRKTFGSAVAVDDMTLDIDQGEFVSLLGPSGCGKTTTLQMLAGFLTPTAGAIRLEDKNLVTVPSNKRGLGIVFQSYALFPHMTVAQNVAFGLEMRNMPRADCARRVTEVLELVGLGAYAPRFPRQLSGGQQQRVALARAISIRPHILLLDEPLSNLDAKLREEMQIELRQIQRQLGTTTVLVTHDQSEAMALSDRIVVMNKGRVEQIGRPDETYELPKTAFVANFLGKTSLLRGTVSEAGAHVAIGDGGWTVTRAPQGPVVVTIRPEKIAFGAYNADGLSGLVKTRIFQGTHWLCQVETSAGNATVIRQNSGDACPCEGSTVRLVWRAEDMILMPAEPSTGA